MKILIISQWFQPEPHYKGLAFAKALQERGHEVSVLTGFPNYPGGQVYPGYKVRPYQHEILEGISVTRACLYPDHGRSAIKRVANYVTFAISSFVISFFLKRPDVVYLYTPPMTAALPALALRLFRRTPFVVDIQDLWPDTLASTGMVSNPLALKLVGYWTNFSLRCAARIVVLSDGFRQELMDRGIKKPIQVIPNWAPPEIISVARNIGPRRTNKDQCFTVLFAGNMGAAQGLETVIEAAQLLREQGVNMRFEMVGGGVRSDAIKTMAASLAPDMVRFHDPRHPSELGSLFSTADALLVHLIDDPLFAITIPSKIQAYLAIGLPILVGVRGDAARMVDDARAGIYFQPGCPKALANTVIRIMKMACDERAEMGRSGRSYYERYLSFEKGTAAIAHELETAALKSTRNLG